MSGMIKINPPFLHHCRFDISAGKEIEAIRLSKDNVCMKEKSTELTEEIKIKEWRSFFNITVLM